MSKVQIRNLQAEQGLLSEVTKDEAKGIFGGEDLRSDSAGTSVLADGTTMAGNFVVSDYGSIWQTGTEQDWTY
jgi:hypothetical protein